MKFLIDENVSGDVTPALRRAGHGVLTASEAGLRGKGDPEVFRRMVSDGRVLLTRDRHFTNPIRFPLNGTPGILFIRHGNRTGPEETQLVLDAITHLRPEEFPDTLVTVGTAGITRR